MKRDEKERNRERMSQLIIIISCDKSERELEHITHVTEMDAKEFINDRIGVLVHCCLICNGTVEGDFIQFIQRANSSQ